MAGSEAGIRRKRIAGVIRKHLSSELVREVADPRLAALAIEEVDVSADLTLARVKVRLVFGGEEPAARQGAMRALSRVAPGLRASLSPVLRMRRVPELRFSYDEGMDLRAEIETALEIIKREDDEKRRQLGLGSSDEPDRSSAEEPVGAVSNESESPSSNESESPSSNESESPSSHQTEH